MYTQCDNCKAIFEVSMREVTVASGKLRCSECDAVFDAMASLSTTMPKAFSASKESISPDNTKKTTTSTTDRPEGKSSNLKEETEQANIIKADLSDLPQTTDNKWLKVAAFSLATLLIAQLLYSNRHFFTNTPVHAPAKIEMLSHNVFAHPNEPNVLLISASMENHADHAQPYPILELKLSDSQAKVVALRRFKPSEYLDTYNKQELMEVNAPITLKLKIADPGSEATRFQFKFL